MGVRRWLQEQRQKHSSASSASQTIAVHSDDARQGQGCRDATNATVPRNTEGSADDGTSRNETNERHKASAVEFTSSTLDNIPIRELWNVAYERLREEDSALIAEYESVLRGVVATGLAQTLRLKPNIREQMWTILQSRMKEVNDNTAKLKLGDLEIEMRDVTQLVLNVVNSANNYISQAVIANPFASIAWTGISFLLPLFINASTQSISLAKGLEYISSLIAQSKMREEIYIQSYESRTDACEMFQQSHREYKAALEGLYRQILTFQATSCCYYSSNSAFRFGLNAVKWNDWDQLMDQVREKEQSFAAVEQIWRDIRHIEEQLANENAMAQDKREKLMEWLSDVDPSSIHNAARDRYEDGTNEWLLKDSEEFKAWETNAMSLLWLHGKAGSGKSVLTSSVINYLQDRYALQPSTALAYFYFTFNNVKKQQADEMLASLIKQICSSRPRVPELIKRLNDYKSKGQRPDTQTLEAALISSTLGFSAVRVVIDGLDECPLLGGEREKLLKSLRRILVAAPKNLHIFLTSRKEPDIDIKIRAILSPPAKIEIDLLDHQQTINNDICQYINLTLATDDFKTWPEKVKEEASQSLVQKADCMFQYVRFQLEELQKLSSLTEIRKALQDLPVGLDATYDRILQNIDNKFQSQVINSLKWLAFSKEILTLKQLSEIFVLHPENDVVFDETERLFSSTDILKYFSGLIITQKRYCSVEKFEDMYKKYFFEVQLAHFSIKEYLTSDRIARNSTSAFSFTEVGAQLYIATSCLAYLRCFATLSKIEREKIQWGRVSSCLADYVVKYWPLHLEEVPRTSWPANIAENAALALAARSESLELQLDQETNTYANPHMLLAPLKPHCYTAQRGFRQLTELLISQEFGTNKYMTQEDLDVGLHVAAHAGHLDIVRLFLEAGANINARCDNWNSALEAAIKGEQIETVEFLVRHGADTKGTPSLNSYLSRSDTRLMEIFLDHGANIDMPDGHRGTALCDAAAEMDSAYFNLLLERGADVNAQGGEYCTPLQAACTLGYKKSELMLDRIQKLLDRGADPNIQGGRYGTALQAVCYQFLWYADDADAAMKAIRLFIEHGAKVNAQGGRYGSPLNAAASSSLPQATRAMKLLLDNGAEIDQRGGNDRATALQYACHMGTIETVRFLLEHGADVNAEGGQYGTPLRAAAARFLDEWSSDEELQTKLLILELLINEGANIIQQGGAALRAAAWDSPNGEVLRLLLAHGVDVNAQDNGSITALIAVCKNLEDDTKCVQMLLDQGADVNAQSDDYGTALISTCRPKHSRRGYDWLYDPQTAVCVAQLLLDRGANVNAQHKKYGTALEAACMWNSELVQLLLKHGADAQLQDCAAWHAAADFDSNYMLKLLLDHGIDINHVSQVQGTALHAKMHTQDIHGYPMPTYVGWPKEVSYLLELGLDPNVTTEKMGSALQMACGVGRFLEDREILNKGALEIPDKAKSLLELCPNINVNAQGGFFGSALQAAAYSGQTILVRLLLDKGANINARGGNYRSALNGAVVRGCWDIAEILLKAGATPDCHLQQQPDEEWLQSVLERDGRGAVERYRKFWAVEMKESKG